MNIALLDKLKFVGQKRAMKRREEVDKYRDMHDDDLQAEVARLKESLFRLNFKLALGEVDAIKKMRLERKSLARIRTMVRQREIQAGK
jgi:large subunit ribosomal protein L29